MTQTPSESMCIRCMRVKARTPQFWRRRKGCKDGLEPHICSQCCNEERRVIEKRKLMAVEAAARRVEKPKRDVHHSQHIGAKLCALCHGMAHRVEGESCRRCGIRAAAEPKPEMQLRKFG